MRYPPCSWFTLSASASTSPPTTACGAVQTLGPILDGVMRNTPDALAWIDKADAAGVSQAIMDRDGPFGDYSQAPADRRPNPEHVIEV